MLPPRAPALAFAFATVAILVTILLSACGSLPSSSASYGGAGIPEWQFRWLPVGSGADASLSPPAAFANAGRAEHVGPGGKSVTEHTPAAVVWLATGHTFGEALVQLDPAGRYWNEVTLLLDANGHAWQALAGDLPPPTSCGRGTPFSGKAVIFGSYCTLEPVRSGTTPAISSALWTTPQSRTFLTERIAATAQRPTGAAIRTFAGYAGWALQANGWTMVVALLSGGDTAIFAGTGDAQVCQDLADSFLRLGADPSILK